MAKPPGISKGHFEESGDLQSILQPPHLRESLTEFSGDKIRKLERCRYLHIVFYWHNDIYNMYLYTSNRLCSIARDPLSPPESRMSIPFRSPLLATVGVPSGQTDRAIELDTSRVASVGFPPPVASRSQAMDQDLEHQLHTLKRLATMDPKHVARTHGKDAYTWRVCA